jgi:hypothetical protein
MSTRSRSVTYAADAWQRPSGIVASAAFQAETAAVRRGLLASRVLSAALRAPAGDLDDVDVDALKTLLGVLEPKTVAAGAARYDDAYAFAQATHAARRAPQQPQTDLSEDLDSVRNDAYLLLQMARAKARQRVALSSQPELIDAAQRLADRFAAVSDAAMTEAGSPGDSLGGLR